MCAERKWCSHNPFKPIWRPPEPTGPQRPAKRKEREDAESSANVEAEKPRHLELDKYYICSCEICALVLCCVRPGFMMYPARLLHPAPRSSFIFMASVDSLP